jgi:hypothetical protein
VNTGDEKVDADLASLVKGEVEWSHGSEVPEEVGRVERQRSEPTASGISSNETPL